MKKILPVLFSIPFLFLLLYLSYYPNLIVHDVTIEYSNHLEINPIDFVDDTSRNIDINKCSLSSIENKVGTQTVTVTFQSISKKAKLTIQDTTPPTFIDFQDELILESGEDILSHFQATDLNKTTISIQENIDSHQPQDTIIHILANDPYNNQTIKECHLIIKEKEKPKPKSENTIPKETIDSPKEETNYNQPMEQAPIYTEPSIPQESIPNIPENVCEFSGSIGNSGMTFNSYGEAITYAESYLMNNLWTVSGYSTQKIGCPDIWTVSFY